MRDPFAGIEATASLLLGSGPQFGPTVTRLPEHERTLLRVLDNRAGDGPDNPWVVFDGSRTLTFSDVMAEALRFATSLRARSFAESHVALLLRNQPEFLPAFFGAQAANGVAVRMNPELRGPLLETLLHRSRATVLVIREDMIELLEQAPGIGGVALIIVCGDTRQCRRIHTADVVGYDEWIGASEPRGLRRWPRHDELAALMFTSGTSGGSKAAMWPHHYLYLTSATVCDSLGHTPRDVVSTPLQMCHIAGLQVIANAALQAGCTAHLQSYFSASSWWDDIARDGATFAMLMGQMAEMILAATAEAPVGHTLSNVYILPQPARREEFERRYLTSVIWQGWGMTEIFPHVPSKNRIEDVPADTIGEAPAWVKFGVVDSADKMVGPGELGEMVYRPTVPYAMAQGYFGDEEATSHAFRNGVFHTGDLGYYDEGHRVHFVMRNQDAIRRRGENISAVELENVARGHPGVADAAAYGVPSELGEHEVKLDLILRDNPPTLDVIHSWLCEQLPRFMIPRYLEARAEFPRTVSQRVEKYKLAEQSLGRSQVREYLAKARTRD